MRKYVIALMFVFITFTAAASLAYSEDCIVETPDVKIIIDGKITTYTDVPLSVNQKTMLPLRDILVNLGVENDDEHIIWNDSDKSVTIYKDSTRIYLKQGSNIAYVNDTQVVLDVAPMGYSKNQRTYIPAAFVSQALGKKIVLDGSAKAVLIRDEEDYNEVRGILDRSDLAMESVVKYKSNMDITASVYYDDFTYNTGIYAETVMDRLQKVMYMSLGMDLFGKDMKTESYYSDNAVYTSNPFTRVWQKKAIDETLFNNLFEQSSNTNVFQDCEPLCAGLVISGSENRGEILLKGDVYMDKLYNSIQGASEYDTLGSGGYSSLEKFYLEVRIDETTYLVNSIYMRTEGFVTYEDEFGVYSSYSPRMVMDLEVTYSDYNGSFELKVPDGLLENAVEDDGNPLIDEPF